MATKEEIRPIYAELQGYLLQAPGGDMIRRIYDPNVWEHYNATIDELNSLSGRCYDRFKLVEVHEIIDNTPCLDVTQYRLKLAGLISRLHVEYYGDEDAPFKTSPGMVINQTQQQSQTVHIQMIMEITEQLTRSEAKFKEDSKERGFIGRAKDFLRSAVNGTMSVAQLLALLLKIAKDCGLNIEDMQNVFGG